MPAVKLLHQESDNVTKPSYIMGHSTQAVSLLARAAVSLFAVPLDMKIHTAYFHAPAIKGKRPRDRPKKFGWHVKLKELFNSAHPVLRIASPVYGEKNVTLKVRSFQLLWKPAGRLVHLVLVDHPTRGKIIMITTDLELQVEEVIRLYGLRFKIELGFKQASQVIGTFDYHFWMKEMVPLKRRNGYQYLYMKTPEYRHQALEKVRSYPIHLIMGIISQGLMQYLSACHTEQVWISFGSWLRTICAGVAPSERVVSLALQNTLPEFLLVNSPYNNLVKFVTDHQDPCRAYAMGIAA